jgi:hypothetical protein
MTDNKDFLGGFKEFDDLFNDFNKVVNKPIDHLVCKHVWVKGKDYSDPRKETEFCIKCFIKKGENNAKK